MSEHCIVNGVRCSKCCEVLTLNVNYNFALWCRYVQKYGVPDSFDPAKHGSESMQIYSMLKPIKKRLAKKINPTLVSHVGSRGRYFTCKNFTGSGCGNYESRPRMCSEYPLYGRSQSEWESSQEFERGGLYNDDCTYYVEVK